MNQRANAAFLCRDKSQWQTFCTSLKARKRRQLQAEVKPQGSRVPAAALVCKSSHARSSSLNERGSDCATPLGKAKVQIRAVAEERKSRGNKIQALGRRFIAYQCLIDMEKASGSLENCKSSTNICKYKVPGTQPSQAVLLSKALQLFIHCHLAY